MAKPKQVVAVDALQALLLHCSYDSRAKVSK